MCCVDGEVVCCFFGGGLVVFLDFGFVVDLFVVDVGGSVDFVV